MKILITGASGMIGTALSDQLEAMGHILYKLSSSNHVQEHSFRWNWHKGIIDPLPYNEIDVVIHLAGAGIVDKKWTIQRKEEILKSRTKALDYLYEGFMSAGSFPKRVITASGVGIYPVDSKEEMTESSPEGTGFVPEVCQSWEQAASAFGSHSDTFYLRLGVVLGKKGFLEKITMPAKYFLGGIPGDGKQWVPWIHINDVVQVMSECAEGRLPPATYNLVAPTFSTLEEITKEAVKAINRPAILPKIPAPIIKWLLGERSILVLGSQKIIPQALLHQKYAFQFTNVATAIHHLMKNK
jgi:uncharacterized protein (TIGR01777 family)